MMGKKLLLAALVAGVTMTGSAGADTKTAAVGDRYAIDPTHTFPNIEFDHMGLSTWRGKFDKTSGNIVIDRAGKTGTVDIVVEIASINFGLAAMDEKARSEDFFNAAKFPKGIYKGKLKFVGDTLKTVDGEITLLGVTKPLQLNVKRFNCIQHPMLKKEVCGADVEGELNWSEYGMKWSKYGEGDAGKLRLSIQVEALKQD